VVGWHKYRNVIWHYIMSLFGVLTALINLCLSRERVALLTVVVPTVTVCTVNNSTSRE
jgi:hypothetical protein